MKRPLLFAVMLACYLKANTQVTRTPLSAPYTSLSTYSNQFKDAFAFRSNSAALAGISRFSAGVFSEQRFMLQELSSYSFAAALPTTSGNFGLRGDYYGGSLYNESSLGLAYGRRLGERIDVGVQFHYHSQMASTYGSATTVTFDAGTIIHLAEGLQTGLHVYNPVGMKLGKRGEEKLPAVYAAGLGYAQELVAAAAPNCGTIFRWPDGQMFEDIIGWII